MMLMEAVVQAKGCREKPEVEGNDSGNASTGRFVERRRAVGSFPFLAEGDYLSPTFD